MNRVIFLLPILVLLSGCGQSGDLYLPDDLRAEQLEQEAVTASAGRAEQLRQQASQLRQRHHELGALRTKLAQLEQREEALREGGESSEADEILKEINRTRHRLGTLILEQQRSR